MSTLNGKVALITGASRGIGRSIALSLGKAGASVAVTDILLENETLTQKDLKKIGSIGTQFAENNLIQTKSTASEIRQMGPQSIALKMDVTSTESISNAISKIQSSLGSIDILVNNAALMGNLSLLGQQDPEQWERDLQVNLTGSFFTTKAVWPGMLKKGWGRVINISSFVGLRGAFATPSYGASKAGLIGLTASLAIEGAMHGITVNAILPGFIETEAVLLHEKHILERVKDHIPMKRLGRPEEVASLVVFLATEAAGYMTGAALPVTGGADLFSF